MTLPNPNFPCPVKNPCVPDAGLSGNQSELAEVTPQYRALRFERVAPPLGAQWDTQYGVAVVESGVSQSSADFAAHEAAVENATTNWQTPDGPGLNPNPPVPPPENTRGSGMPFIRYFNAPQTAVATCPDGSPFLYTVPAGVFGGFSQIEADTAALSYAQEQAPRHVVCLSSLPSAVCLNAFTSMPVTVTGGSVQEFNVWEVMGVLPNGLTFPVGNLPGATQFLQGTPNQLGTFVFAIGVTTPAGDFMQKVYTVNVAEITSASTLPSIQQRQPYSFQFTQTGLANPSWSIVGSGAPASFGLSAGGLLTNNSLLPTPAPGTYNFVIGVTDGVTLCTQAVSLTVTAWWNLTWDPPPYIVSTPPFTASFTPQTYALTVQSGGVIENSNGLSFFNPPALTTNCNLHLVVTGTNPVFTFVQVQQNPGGGGPLLLSEGITLAPGTYDFPFTVPFNAGPPGVNQIQVTVELQGTGQPGTATVTGTFQVV